MGLKGHMEFVVKRKVEGGLLALRVVLLLLYTVPFLLLAVVLALHALYFALPVLAILDAILILMTWNRTNQEYEYVLDGTVLSFAVIRGRNSRRELGSADLRRVDIFAPADGPDLARWRGRADRIRDLRSSSRADNGYFLRIPYADGSSRLYLFDCFEELLDAVAACNFTAVRRKAGLPKYFLDRL